MFNPPTLEDLQETRRANEKLVLEALESKPEWVETDLARTTGLALSHLRGALQSLLDQGRVRRLPGTGTRAVYGIADPGFTPVEATPLTPDAEAIVQHLQGRGDSAFHIGEQLDLTREEVMAALSLMNAHNMLSCTFVGSLVVFRLKENTPVATVPPVVPDEAPKPAPKPTKGRARSKAKDPEAVSEPPVTLSEPADTPTKPTRRRVRAKA